MSEEKSKPPTDDLEAVRKVIEALTPFEAKDQERIIRWAKEKLGLSASSQVPLQEKTREEGSPPAQAYPLSHKKHAPDIKTFVAEKNPASDIHLATTVAYYYRFEAPESEQKDSISGDDLQEACRKAVGRLRLKNPNKTLANAHRGGLLDRTGEGGKYTINTVGENLVAIVLSGGAVQKTTPRKRESKKVAKQASPKKDRKQKDTKRK